MVQWGGGYVEAHYTPPVRKLTPTEYDKLLSSMALDDVKRIRRWHSPALFLGFIASGNKLSEPDRKAIRLTAADPQLDSETLTLLYRYALQFPDPEATIQVVTHPNLPEDTIREAATLWLKHVWGGEIGYSETVSAYALSNTSLKKPLEFFLGMLRDAGNNTMQGVLPPPRVRTRTRGTRKSSSGFTQEDMYVKALVNPDVGTPPSVLDELYSMSTRSDLMTGYNPLKWVTAEVVKHPNCSPETLVKLFWLWKKEEEKHSTWTGNPYLVTVKGLLSNPTCPVELLHEACWCTDASLRSIAADHPNCPAEDAVAAALLSGEGEFFS